MRDVCIVFAGTKFTTEHIVQKRKQLDHHSSVPTRLTVLTDDPALVTGIGLRDTRAVLLPEWQLTDRQLWWYKVFMFSDAIEWSGPVLYLDLDTIIVQDFQHFYTHESNRFVICQDFNRAFISNYPVSNSSVIRYDPKQYTKIYSDFVEDRTNIIRKYRGDQDYLTEWFRTRDDCVWWPRAWCMSYKWEIVHGGSRRGGPDIEYPKDYLQPDIDWLLDSDCSIAVFHGKPMPYETEFGRAYTY